MCIQMFWCPPTHTQKKPRWYPRLQLHPPTLSYLIGDWILQLTVFLNEERESCWSLLHELGWDITHPWVSSGFLHDSCQGVQQQAVVCHFSPTGCHQTVPTGAQTLDHTCKSCEQQWACITGLKFHWFVVFHVVGFTGQVWALFMNTFTSSTLQLSFTVSVKT